MNQNSIKEKEWSFTSAFNKDCSIVAVGYKNKVKIYEFKQGMMKYIQVLNNHKGDVHTLNFMKQSNQFISGDKVGSILIWSNNNNNQWNCTQNIEGHTNQIKCLILNNEDHFISSSEDTTIKQKEFICQQTITVHTKQVFQLSLNEQQNQVISCGWDQLILIIEYSEQNKSWIVIQNIKVDCQGYRLCFINDNLYTFQPYKGNLMFPLFKIFQYSLSLLCYTYKKNSDLSSEQLSLHIYDGIIVLTTDRSQGD